MLKTFNNQFNWFIKARRDEFEYEKEIRNKFITLLIDVQEKRRKMMNVNGKKQKQNGMENGQNPVNNNVFLPLFTFFLKI